MTRLIVVVEGPTEEAFIKDVLKPHLDLRGIYTSATIVGKVTAQKRGHRGWGGGHFKNWRKDIQRLLGHDRSPDLRVSTLFDLYGLPNDFPGLKVHAAEVDTNRRCDALQTALAQDFDDERLIPYIQRHEFEALVLAALPSLSDVLDASDDLAGLAALAAEIGGRPPEDINDSKNTSPSSRLLTHVPSYTKTLHGPLATSGAGLPSLRSVCPRFDAWVRRLEALSPSDPALI